METIYLDNPLAIGSVLIKFLDSYATLKNQSARRHFAKILAQVTKSNAPSAIKTMVSDYDFEPLVNTNFDWLIDENVPVAVKSHCLNILANLSVKHTWVKEELVQTMDYLIDKESIAFFAKVKQIRKKLRVKSSN